jgi:hypothetical protein
MEMNRGKFIQASVVFLISIFLFACAPTRVVKTIPKGKTNITASLGGPLIAYHNLTIPMPLTSVSGAYGIKDDLTGFAGLHTTALAFGVIQADLGVTKRLKEQNNWSPGISVSPVANFMYDTWEHHFKFYPEIDINAYWNYRKKQNFIYAGISNWFELASKRAFDEPQPNNWIPGFYVGHTWSQKIMEYTIEAKYLEPFTNNKNLVVQYTSFGNTGAIGIYFGITRKF